MTNRLHNPRATPVLALIIGIALIPVGIAIAISDHRGQQETNRRALADEAGTQFDPAVVRTFDAVLAAQSAAEHVPLSV
jgi:hypothetical protein